MYISFIGALGLAITCKPSKDHCDSMNNSIIMKQCVLVCINLTIMQGVTFFWGGALARHWKTTFQMELLSILSQNVYYSFLFNISHASSSHLEFQSFPFSSTKSINKPSLALPICFFPFLADDPFPTLCGEESEGQLPQSLEDFGLLNVLCHMKTYKFMTFNLF